MEASLLKMKATPLGTDVVAPPVNACKYGVTACPLVSASV